MSYFPKFKFSWYFPIFFFQVFILSIFPILTVLSTLSHIQIVSLVSSHSILHSTSQYKFPEFHLHVTSPYNFLKFYQQNCSNFVPFASTRSYTLSSHSRHILSSKSRPWSYTASLQFFQFHIVFIKFLPFFFHSITFSDSKIIYLQCPIRGSVTRTVFLPFKSISNQRSKSSFQDMFQR